MPPISSKKKIHKIKISENKKKGKKIFSSCASAFCHLSPKKNQKRRSKKKDGYPTSEESRGAPCLRSPVQSIKRLGSLAPPPQKAGSLAPPPQKAGILTSPLPLKTPPPASRTARTRSIYTPHGGRSAIAGPWKIWVLPRVRWARA